MAQERKTEMITLRLPKNILDTLEMIAAGERSTVSGIIRLAIDQYLNPTKKKGSE
jgi:hypothetical protein